MGREWGEWVGGVSRVGGVRGRGLHYREWCVPGERVGRWSEVGGCVR